MKTLTAIILTMCIGLSIKAQVKKDLVSSDISLENDSIKLGGIIYSNTELSLNSNINFEYKHSKIEDSILINDVFFTPALEIHNLESDVTCNNPYQVKWDLRNGITLIIYKNNKKVGAINFDKNMVPLELVVTLPNISNL